MAGEDEEDSAPVKRQFKRGRKMPSYTSRLRMSWDESPVEWDTSDPDRPPKEVRKGTKKFIRKPTEEQARALVKPFNSAENYLREREGLNLRTAYYVKEFWKAGTREYDVAETDPVRLQLALGAARASNIEVEHFWKFIFIAHTPRKVGFQSMEPETAARVRAKSVTRRQARRASAGR